MANQRQSLIAALKASWSADTSFSSDQWNVSNPAFGQCAVSALVLQDHLGGEILRGIVGDVSHYFNRLGDGTILDSTWSQFGVGDRLDDVRPSDRSILLANADTNRRYGLL